MDLNELGAIAGVVAVVGGAVSAFTNAVVKTSVSGLKSQVQQWRSADKDEIRTWINGSFLRAHEARAKMEGLERTIEDHHESTKDKLDIILRRLSK